MICGCDEMPSSWNSTSSSPWSRMASKARTPSSIWSSLRTRRPLLEVDPWERLTYTTWRITYPSTGQMLTDTQERTHHAPFFSGRSGCPLGPARTSLVSGVIATGGRAASGMRRRLSSLRRAASGSAPSRRRARACRTSQKRRRRVADQRQLRARIDRM